MWIDIILLIIIVIYAGAQALANMYHDYERDEKLLSQALIWNKKWHFFQGIEHVTVFLGITIAYFITSWEILITLPFIYWFMFDGFRAKTLKKKWFYLGKTSKLDSFKIITTIIKSILFITSIILYLVFKLT